MVDLQSWPYLQINFYRSDVPQMKIHRFIYTIYLQCAMPLMDGHLICSHHKGEDTSWNLMQGPLYFLPISDYYKLPSNKYGVVYALLRTNFIVSTSNDLVPKHSHCLIRKLSSPSWRVEKVSSAHASWRARTRSWINFLSQSATPSKACSGRFSKGSLDGSFLARS